MNPNSNKKYREAAAAENLKGRPTLGLVVALRGVLARLTKRRGRGETDPFARLSRRERQVLELLGQNLSNVEIADKLDITPATVGKHLSNLRAKLECKTRSELYVWYHQYKNK